VNEPIHGAECQDCGRQREHLCCVRGREIDDHQLADDREQCDQEYGANLNDAMSALRDYQQRSLKLERDDDVKIIPNSDWNTA
jgi:hypothetical protein